MSALAFELVDEAAGQASLSVVVAGLPAGYLLLGEGEGPATAVVLSVAAGAILTMIADTMLPEAFERAHLLSGLVTTLGFLTAFVVGRSGG